MDLSLYRKFRPDSFSKIVRQEHVVRILKNQIMSGSVGHAYLFCGPRGTGKTSVARILARAVNCEHPIDGSPCGQCPTCLALKEDSLDITEIDAASNNGVAEMRDLREKVQYPPVAGKYKVYIIDEVHMLTDSAFNALLKTLEEPPRHVIFILATTEPHKLPATILSRCMRLDFKLIPEEDLEKHLSSILDEIKKPYEAEAVSAIARAGAGSDRDMLSIAQMCISYEDKLTYEGVVKTLGAADFFETATLCESLLKSDLSSTLEQTEKLLNEGKSAGVLLRDLIEMTNKILIAKSCRTAERVLSLPKEHFARVREIALLAENCALRRTAEILASAENTIRFSSSPRVALETALFRIAEPKDDLTYDALLVRVSQLEKGVSAPRTETIPKEERPVEEAAERAVEMPVKKIPVEIPVESPAIHAPEPEKRELPKEDSPFSSIAAAPVREGIPLTAERAYGKFMGALRKRGGAVLFALCNDLEAKFEGEKLILYTPNEMLLKTLSKSEHRATMTQIFSSLGIGEFELRCKGASVPSEKRAIDELRENFKDYPIEFKD